MVGSPRSGTTLIAEVLDAHPAVAIGPETHYYNVFAHDCDREDCLGHPDKRREFLQMVLSSAAAQQMALPDDLEERVLDAIDENAPSHRDVLGTILSGYARARGAERWGEKTPRHLEWVPRIVEDFPNARVLCIVRDPRDVALSREKTPWESSIWRSAKDWMRHARMADENADRFPDSFTEVRYEDLLADPEAVVERLCEFVDLSFDPSMLSFHEGSSRTFEMEAEPWKKKASEPIDPSNREKWRDQMGAADRWIVEQVAGEGMATRGYPRQETSLSLGQAVHVTGSYLRHMVKWTKHEVEWFVEAKIRSPSYASPLDED